MASLRAVLFDYGDTLITIRRPDEEVDAAYRGIAAYLSAGPGRIVPPATALRSSIHDQLEAAVVAHAQSGDLEEIDLPALAMAAFAAIGLELTPEELDEVARREQEAWWAGITVTPNAGPVLGELRGRGLRVGLCSNAPYPEASLRAQLDAVGLGPLIDSTTFSGEVGWRKPAPIMFHTALHRLGVEPDQAVMVGDSARADIAGARAAGMRTIRLRQHRDDGGTPADADAVIDRIDELPDVLSRWSDQR